jgi:hypothetical protein
MLITSKKLLLAGAMLLGATGLTLSHALIFNLFAINHSMPGMHIASTNNSSNPFLSLIHNGHLACLLAGVLTLGIYIYALYSKEFKIKVKSLVIVQLSAYTLSYWLAEFLLEGASPHTLKTFLIGSFSQIPFIILMYFTLKLVVTKVISYLKSRVAKEKSKHKYLKPVNYQYFFNLNKFHQVNHLLRAPPVN